MSSPWCRVFLRELRTIFSDRRVLTLMIGGPFLYALAFGGVYYHGRVRQVPMLVIDQDNSQLSRELVTAALASDSLSLAGYARNADEFMTATRRGTAYLALVIPQHFQRDLQRGHQGQVLVLADASNILICNVAYRSIRVVLSTFRVGARTKRLLAQGIPSGVVLKSAMPIQAQIRPLSNPASNYASFILVGLVCIALQQVTMMGAGICTGLDYEERRRRELLGAGRRPVTVLLGKVAAHAVVMTTLGLVAIYLPFGLFHVSFHGSLPLLLGVTALFIVLQVLAGLGVGAICRSPLFAAHLLLCLSVPFFTVAGVTWPTQAMPHWVQFFSYALPLTHYTQLARKLSLMGALPAYVLPQVLGIIVWLPVATVWAYLGVRDLLAAGADNSEHNE